MNLSYICKLDLIVKKTIKRTLRKKVKFFINETNIKNYLKSKNKI